MNKRDQHQISSADVLELKMRNARLTEEVAAMRFWIGEIKVNIEKIEDVIEYIKGKYTKTVEK